MAHEPPQQLEWPQRFHDIEQVFANDEEELLHMIDEQPAAFWTQANLREAAFHAGANALNSLVLKGLVIDEPFLQKLDERIAAEYGILLTKAKPRRGLRGQVVPPELSKATALDLAGQMRDKLVAAAQLAEGLSAHERLELRAFADARLEEIREEIDDVMDMGGRARSRHAWREFVTQVYHSRKDAVAGYTLAHAMRDASALRRARDGLL